MRAGKGKRGQESQRTGFWSRCLEVPGQDSWSCLAVKSHGVWTWLSLSSWEEQDPAKRRLRLTLRQDRGGPFSREGWVDKGVRSALGVFPQGGRCLPRCPAAPSSHPPPSWHMGVPRPSCTALTPCICEGTVSHWCSRKNLSTPIQAHPPKTPVNPTLPVGKLRPARGHFLEVSQQTHIGADSRVFHFASYYHLKLWHLAWRRGQVRPEVAPGRKRPEKHRGPQQLGVAP